VPALNRFIVLYWKPVFYFLRARGQGLHQAEDLTQAFFTRLLERDWVRRADPQRGRFRTFLLTLLTPGFSFGSCQGASPAGRLDALGQTGGEPGASVVGLGPRGRPGGGKGTGGVTSGRRPGGVFRGHLFMALT
jgi:hypothetical protein